MLIGVSILIVIILLALFNNKPKKQLPSAEELAASDNTIHTTATPIKPSVVNTLTQPLPQKHVAQTTEPNNLSSLDDTKSDPTIQPIDPATAQANQLIN